MSIVAEIVKKMKVGSTEGIGSAGTAAKDLDAFKTVLSEAHALRDNGTIEIVEEAADRVRFKRLK